MVTTWLQLGEYRTSITNLYNILAMKNFAYDFRQINNFTTA